MIPLLVGVVAFRGGLQRVLAALKSNPTPWVVWGTVGFGLFYIPICLAAEVAPPWLIAGTWQVTIVAGALLSRYFGDMMEHANASHGEVFAFLVLSWSVSS